MKFAMRSIRIYHKDVTRDTRAFLCIDRLLLLVACINAPDDAFIDHAIPINEH
jgi:hypothetical protein